MAALKPNPPEADTLKQKSVLFETNYSPIQTSVNGNNSSNTRPIYIIKVRI